LVTAFSTAQPKTPATVQQAFEEGLGTALTAASDQSGKQPIGAIAVALSGGLDSSVLLHLAHGYAVREGLTLFAFHIHHGLSPNADAWLAHCAHETEQLGVAFFSHHITIGAVGGGLKNGVEEAARLKRYAALGQLCRTHHAPLLLTAHHQDDQAETVLLQLLRGSGVAGLSGMDLVNSAPDLLGSAELTMARPLLMVARTDLAAWASGHNIAFVEDESNTDPRYARNALRQLVLPALAQYFPGFQQRFARSAQHAQAAQRLLIELAAQDLTQCQDGACLDIAALQQLSADRCYNLLRYWFGVHGLRMPSTAWLSELRGQLLDARSDAQLRVTHPDCELRRHRNRAYIVPRFAQEAADVAPQTFYWQGEPSIRFAAFGGVLHFDPATSAEPGIDAAWLRAQSLQIAYRSGGERLKLAANRPTKSLKYHYQAFDVPAWERERLPLVLAKISGSPAAQLLFAAGIGMDCHYLGNQPNAAEPQIQRVRLRWQPDTTRFQSHSSI
jgi:tRNA(Ile)-lysidine synthase